MSDEQSHLPRRLYWERYPPSNTGNIEHSLEQLIRHLEEDGVGTVFIVSSEDVDAEEYLSLIGELESRGGRVRNIHLVMQEETLFNGMVKVLDEIVGRFTEESCLVLSYGSSLAPLLIACYNVRAGETPSKAINKVRKIDPLFLRDPEEKAFVYTFGKRIHSNDNDSELFNVDLLPWHEK